MNLCGKLVRPGLLYFNNEFREELVLKIDQDGRIGDILEADKLVGDDAQAVQAVQVGQVVQLENEAFLPGFVNSHSHAFHRQLRGKSGIGESGPMNFWKWRDAMYGLVAETNYESIFKYCVDTFSEMLRAGITSVGEFHYVHHSDEDRFDLDRAVIQAARETGIRLVLIVTLYCRSGFNESDVISQQRRFKSNVEELVEHVRTLKKEGLPQNVKLAVAAHSLRAVPVDQLKRLYEFAQQEDLPFHIHLEEQPKEIRDCEIVECCAPSEMLLHALPEMDERLTAVHCTYTKRKNLNQFASKGVNISICPLTEGFLGDGIPHLDAKDNLSVGTDCNNRLCFLEELRWLAYGQNMKTNTRNACNLDAARLLEIATTNGALSLGLQNETGRIKKNFYADFVSINLKAKRLEGIARDGLLDALIFGCGNEEIHRTFVSGIEH